MVKIYTKTGDAGETSLFDGNRVSKSHARIKLLGELDLLNSYFGSIDARNFDSELCELISGIQISFIRIGSYIATPNPVDGGKSEIRYEEQKQPRLLIEEVQNMIDRMDGKLPPLTNFILPRGNIEIIRAVCRKFEIQLIEFSEMYEEYMSLVPYFNRLSDFLWILARYERFLTSSEYVVVLRDWTVIRKYNNNYRLLDKMYLLWKSLGKIARGVLD